MVLQLSDLDFNSAVKILNLPDATADQHPATFTQLKQRQGITVLSVSPSASQSNYNPSNLATADILLVSATASIGIKSIAAQSTGKVLTVANGSTDYILWLEHNDASATTGNAILLSKAFPFFLMPGRSISLYYNGSNWVPRGTSPVMGLDYFTDFLGGFLPANTTSGTGAVVRDATFGVNTTEKAVGVAECFTGSTASGRATLNLGNNDFVGGQEAALSVARIGIDTSPTSGQDFQVGSGFANVAANDVVAWAISRATSTTNYVASAVRNGTGTASTTGTPAISTTEYIWAIVFINPGWTRADFIYSTDSRAFTLANSITTNIPDNTRTVTWAPLSIVKLAGSSGRSAFADLVGYCLGGSVRG